MNEPIKLLLIEDSEGDYLLLKALLAEVGYQSYKIEWIESYAVARERLRTTCDFDVCLLDYMLAGYDGIELLREAVANGCTAPIIVMTGRAEYEVDLAVMRAGAADFLSKNDLHPDTLERTLRYAVQQRRAEEQRLRLIAESEARQHAEALARTLAESEAKLKQLNESLEVRVAERTAVAEQRALQLRELTGELTQAEQRERRRLAQVLHDHLQQLLVAMKLKLGKAVYTNDVACLSEVVDLIDQCIAASRSLTVELSPPVLYDAGLAAGLAWLARWMKEKHGLEVELVSDTSAQPEDEDLRVYLFNCARELLFNIVKHAGTMQATLALERDGDDALIRVSDTGRGFDKELLAQEASAGRAGFGLFSIRERTELFHGQFTLETIPGAGTTISLRVPLGRRTRPPALLASK